MSMSPRLLRPRATGFNPKSISGLAAWWDFSDATTVTVATGISSVSDKSGNGRALVQNTANNQPALGSNVIGGKSAAVFDGSNDGLNAAFSLSQAITLLIVGKWNTSSFGTQTMVDGNAGNTMRLFRSSATQLTAFAGASLVSGNTAPESPHVYEVIFNGASSSITIDGVASASGNAGSGSPGGIWLGVFGNGFSNPAPASISEVILYSASLTSTNASRVRKYLGSKYGIAVI